VTPTFCQAGQATSRGVQLELISLTGLHKSSAGAFSMFSAAAADIPVLLSRGVKIDTLEEFLARKVIFVSDLSDKEINEKDAARVVITYADARRGQIVLDVNANEVDNLANKGTRQARRGRRPKAAA
jgi:hypothetical protein